jgi:protein ImuB
MHRVLYVFLPSWPIDRLRRSGLLPKPGAPPDDSASDQLTSSFPRKRESRASDERSPWPPACAGVTKQNLFESPFATVIAASGRQVLAAVNPAAAAKGLAAGMPLADALSFLPGLLTRAAELVEDSAALRRLAEWCGRYSPWTAPDGADGIKIETTGSAHLWGGEAEFAADLSQRLARQEIAHRLAIADTLGAAWAVARYAPMGQDHGAPVIVAPQEIREALAPLPVAALRLDRLLVQGLHRVGLRRVGEIMAMPRDALARRFGEDLGRRLDQALGELPEPLSPLGEVPTRRVRLSFAEPIADPADLARAAERLAGDLVARLAREGAGARRLDLGFHRVDGRVEHIRIGTARPSRDPGHLAKLLIGKLDTIDPGLGIEDMILAAFAVEPLAPEQIECPVLSKGNPLPRERVERGDYFVADFCRDLAPLFDRLGARLGLGALARLEPRESHIPERASMAAPLAETETYKKPPRSPIGEKGSPRNGPQGRLSGGRGAAGNPHTPIPAGQARGLAANAAMGPFLSRNAEKGLKPPRPIRLFARPEPVEAFWVLPDDPPFRFTWRRRTHRIAQADGPERIAEEWWRPIGQITDAEPVGGAGASPWSLDAIRDYYRVEDETGRRFWLFRSGLPGDPPPRWFVHGVFA